MRNPLRTAVIYHRQPKQPIAKVMKPDPEAAPAAHSPADHVVADQGEVAAFLAAPATYGPEVKRVERIDTHGAMIFLAEDQAYKIKRAVDFPYMDYSTLARRRGFCEREVEINRRTAPDLYLDVRPVVRRADGSLELGGTGEPVEWVVVMRRFAQEDLFDRMAEAGKLTPGLMTTLADEVAAFHRDAEVIKATTGDGGLGEVVAENAAEFAERSDLFPVVEAEAFAEAALGAHRAVRGLLGDRAATGFRRRCHGDLHLRNIYLHRGLPTLFDAIEFNDSFAVIDVFYDFAFLLMDLEHRKLRAFANLVLNRYLQRTGDLGSLAALPLFLSQRAAVRAKVSAAAELSQSKAPARRHLHDEALAYLRLAASYLKPGAPRLVAIGGLSGSGKTSLARRLAPGIGRSPGALHLRSDVIRKELHGAEELSSLPPEAYGPGTSRRVYDTMIARARSALAGGHSVILDAVYAREAERAAPAALGRALGVGFTGFWLEASEGLMVERVESRRNDASDATPEVVRRQLGYDLGALTWHRLDASGSLEDAAKAAEGLL
jgi:aminoglycoside phosphotransferase family enzyme/cytidylate kinase